MNPLYEPSKPTDGLKDQQALIDNGASPDDLTAWRNETRDKLIQNGATQNEVDQHFGVPNFPDQKINQQIKDRLGLSVQDPTKEVADTFEKAWKMGTQESVTGLIAREKMPDYAMPDGTGIALQIVRALGHIPGDLPTLWAGFEGGAAAAAPTAAFSGPIGPTMGAFFGAGFLTHFTRQHLIDAYEKGSVQDFPDFWARYSKNVIESTKEGVVNAATGGVGQGIAAKIGRALSPTQTAGKLAAQVAVMANTGALLDGRVANPQDYAVAGVGVLALHVAAEAPSALLKSVRSKFTSAYVENESHPVDTFQRVKDEPAIAHELMSSQPGPPPFSRPVTPPVEPPPFTKDTVTAEGHPFKAETQLLPREDGTNQYEGVVSERAADGSSIETRIPIKINEPPKSEEPPQHSEVVQKVLNTIKLRGVKPGEKPTLDDVIYNTLDKLHWSKRWLDAVKDSSDGKKFEDLNAATRYVPERGPDEAHRAEAMARNYSGIVNRIVWNFENNQIDINNNIVGPSLNSLFKDKLKSFQDAEEFRSYAISKRYSDLFTNGKITTAPLPKESYDSVVKELGPKHQLLLNNLTKFNNNYLQYMVDSGWLSKDASEQMRTLTENYVSLERAIEGKTPRSGGRSVSPQKAFHELSQGSELANSDPIAAYYDNVMFGIRQAHKNLIVRELYDTWKRSGSDPDLLKVTQVNKDSAFLASKLKDNQLAMGIDGKRYTLDFPPNVAESLKGLDQLPQALVIRALSMPAKIARKGIVETPAYWLANSAKDIVDLGIKSSNPGNPLKKWVEGMVHIATKSKTWEDWWLNGGAHSALRSVDPKFLEDVMPEIYKKGGANDHRNNVLKTTFRIKSALQIAADKYSEFGQAFENASRVGEYSASLKNNKDPVAAITDSREGTVDFQRQGAHYLAQLINSTTRFQGGRIQGLAQIVDSARRDPKGFMARGAAVSAITIPLTLLGMRSKDWNTLSPEDKDANWPFLLGDYKFRVPKPQELGFVFGTLPQRVVEAYLTDHPEERDNWLHDVLGVNEGIKGLNPGMNFGSLAKSGFDLFNPLDFPDVPKAMVEYQLNKSMFTNSDIIKGSAERFLPENKYTRYTSETAKLFGKAMSSLPIVGQSKIAYPEMIDHQIDTWLGGLGKDLTFMSDKLLGLEGKTLPTRDWAENPFVGRFLLKDVNLRSQVLQDARANSNEAAAAIDDYRKKRESPPAYLASMARFNQYFSQVSKLMNRFYETPTLSPDEKHDFIHRLLSNAATDAARANDYYNSEKKKDNKR